MLARAIEANRIDVVTVDGVILRKEQAIPEIMPGKDGPSCSVGHDVGTVTRGIDVTPRAQSFPGCFPQGNTITGDMLSVDGPPRRPGPGQVNPAVAVFRHCHIELAVRCLGYPGTVSPPQKCPAGAHPLDIELVVTDGIPADNRSARSVGDHDGIGHRASLGDLHPGTSPEKLAGVADPLPADVVVPILHGVVVLDPEHDGSAESVADDRRAVF